MGQSKDNAGRVEATVASGHALHPRADLWVEGTTFGRERVFAGKPNQPYVCMCDQMLSGLGGGGEQGTEGGRLSYCNGTAEEDQ